MRIIIIGAGIFGITTALELSKNHDVTLVDMNNDIMQNASKVNHNRLHFGFHYPRSKETALQSLDGYRLFHEYFKNEMTNDFDNYYMIEKHGKVNSKYYENFCDDLKLEYKKQYPQKIDINFENIEASYLTKEPIFDYDLIKIKLENEIKKSKIRLILNKKITNKKDLENYDVIVNTTYFNMNKINRIFNLEETLLRLQTVVIPIFKYDMNRIGITIMDGGYCSILPKGFNDKLFLLYNAKESVIYQTYDHVIPKLWYYGKEVIKNDFMKNNIYDKIIVKRNINTIVEESKKYFNFLKDCDFIDYWQTIRALPINDNDERLSIFKTTEQEDKKIISVLSGKITTCLLIANNINKSI